MAATQNSSNRSFYIRLTASLLWMAIIFYKSAESYQEQSLRPFLSGWFQDSSFPPWLPHLEFTYDQQLVSWRDPQGLVEFFIRKAGHVMEYAILSLLWSYTLLRKAASISTTLYTSSLISLLYAASDEWHQTYVPGRTGHAIDIAVDAIGIALAASWVIASRAKLIRSKK